MVENLDNLKNLTEIDISDQKIENSLVFNEKTMINLSLSLRILETRGNKINDTRNLSSLKLLEILNLADNSLEKIEDLEIMLPLLSNIKNIDLRENLICKIPKYRDQIIMIANESLGF